MIVEYRNGHHILIDKGAEIALTDSGLANIPTIIGLYLDSLPDDVFRQLSVELEKREYDYY